MIELTSDEARVIGVLIEKELTTPEQYPLTVNGIVNGANQKNNRCPVMCLEEMQIRTALVGLRGKGLVVQVDAPGQRASKFRHQVINGLNVNKPEMVILAELMLRGPQTLGELRGHCSRMHNMDSLDLVRNVLQQLIERPEPMVRQVAPAPGSRAERFIQLISPDLHPLDAAPSSTASDSDAAAGMPAAGAPTLSERVGQLESQVQQLTDALRKLAQQVGADDPLPGATNEPPPQP